MALCGQSTTGFSFSREKVMAAKLRTIFVTDSSEKTNDLDRLQHIASSWYSMECYLVLTFCSKILSKNKWMIIWFDLQLLWLKVN